MQVILLQNTIISGRRYKVGESADVDEAFAKKMEAANLCHIVPELAPEVEPEEKTEPVVDAEAEPAPEPVADAEEEPTAEKQKADKKTSAGAKK